jgi:hypothetical protein
MKLLNGNKDGKHKDFLLLTVQQYLPGVFKRFFLVSRQIFLVLFQERITDDEFISTQPF